MIIAKPHEKGAALITVLFIIMVASLIIMAMLLRQRLDVDRTTTIVAQSQAYAYAIGAEELARQVLAEDAHAAPRLDYLGQHWAQLKAGIPVEHGTLSVRLEDLQGRFNINTLIGMEAAKARFTQLAHLLQLRDAVAPLIIASVGTKTNSHLYVDITQLRTLPGITPEEVNALMPYIWALPERDSELNINTAAEKVLRAYIAGDRAYANVFKALTEKGFMTAGQLNAIGTNTKGMTVESNNFRLDIQAQIAGRTVSMTSIIARDTDILGNIHMRVVSRDLSGTF